MALAWRSESPKRVIRPSRAVSRSCGPADELDDLVDVVERDLQAEQDVLARLGLLQLEAGAPGDHVAPVLDEVLQHLLERRGLRGWPSTMASSDDAEDVCSVGVLVELVQDDLRHRVLLQLDDDAHALAVALVAHVGDALDALLAHQLGDAARRSRALFTW